MKKILTTIVTVATVVMVACASVFAAGSSTGLTEIASAVDANGNPIETTVSESSVPMISPEIAAEVAEEDAAAMMLVWQRDVTASVLPATITFNINGTEGQELYVFHWNGSAWELITTGEGPAVTATFTSLSPIAIVAKQPVAEAAEETVEEEATSPETGSTVLLASLATLSVAGSSAFVVAKKEEA